MKTVLVTGGCGFIGSRVARQGDIVLYWTDNRKAAQKLGWQPKKGLRDGFAEIFAWTRENEAELRRRYCP